MSTMTTSQQLGLDPNVDPWRNTLHIFVRHPLAATEYDSVQVFPNRSTQAPTVTVNLTLARDVLIQISTHEGWKAAITYFKSLVEQEGLATLAQPQPNHEVEAETEAERATQPDFDYIVYMPLEYADQVGPAARRNGDAIVINTAQHPRRRATHVGIELMLEPGPEPDIEHNEEGWNYVIREFVQYLMVEELAVIKEPDYLPEPVQENGEGLDDGFAEGHHQGF
ncbi:hypothetical protein K490DRAFT_60761, partial [Saccharata proteae CBS 121410]